MRPTNRTTSPTPSSWSTSRRTTSPRILHVSHVSPHSLMALVVAADREGRVPFDLGMREVDEGVQVAPFDGVDHLVSKTNVLLRHPWRSISRRGMGREGLEPSTLRLRVWFWSCGWLRLVEVFCVEAAVSCLRRIRRFAAGHGWCVAHPLPIATRSVRRLRGPRPGSRTHRCGRPSRPEAPKVP